MASSQDNASAAISGVILIIILVIFVVIAAHLGITLHEIWNDFQSFLTGSP